MNMPAPNPADRVTLPDGTVAKFHHMKHIYSPAVITPQPGPAMTITACKITASQIEATKITADKIVIGKFPLT